MDIGFASMETSPADTPSVGAAASKIADSQTLSSTSNRTSTLSPGAARDRRQTLFRYQVALEELQTALADASGVWRNFNTAKFSCNIAPAESIIELQSTINETMNAHALAQTNPQGWENVKQVMKSVFVATSPFVKVFLVVAKQHSLAYYPPCFV
jgi:hypothetical protein